MEIIRNFFLPRVGNWSYAIHSSRTKSKMMLFHGISPWNCPSDGRKCSTEPILTKGSTTRIHRWRRGRKVTHKLRFTRALCGTFAWSMSGRRSGKPLVQEEGKFTPRAERTEAAEDGWRWGSNIESRGEEKGVGKLTGLV